MKNLIVMCLALAMFASCQSNNSSSANYSSNASRGIANTKLLRSFIDDIAKQTQGTARRYTSEQRRSTR